MIVFQILDDISLKAFDLFICSSKLILSFVQIVTVYNHKSNLSQVSLYEQYQQWHKMRSRLLLQISSVCIFSFPNSVDQQGCDICLSVSLNNASAWIKPQRLICCLCCIIFQILHLSYFLSSFLNVQLQPKNEWSELILLCGRECCTFIYSVLSGPFDNITESSLTEPSAYIMSSDLWHTTWKTLQLMFWYLDSYSPGREQIMSLARGAHWIAGFIIAVTCLQQLLLSNSMSKSKNRASVYADEIQHSAIIGLFIWESDTVLSCYWQVHITVCTSQPYEDNKVAFTVISCNILFLLPSFFTQTATCWLLPQCVHRSECIH